MIRFGPMACSSDLSIVYTWHSDTFGNIVRYSDVQKGMIGIKFPSDSVMTDPSALASRPLEWIYSIQWLVCSFGVATTQSRGSFHCMSLFCPPDCCVLRCCRC